MRTIINRLSSGVLSLVLLVTPVAFSAVNMKLGLDVPLWQQFGTWWLHLLMGDFGYSYLLNQPVGVLVGVYEANTLTISVAALLLSTAASIGIGMLQGVYAEHWIGRCIGAAQLAAYALPSFFVATMLVLGFSVPCRSCRLWALPAAGSSITACSTSFATPCSRS